MVYLGPWGGASIVRLERQGRKWSLVRKATDNSKERRVQLADSARVSSSQADSLIAVIQRSRYWAISAPSPRVVLDGYRVVLEARVEGKYFTVNSWMPERTGATAVVETMRAFTDLSRVTFAEPVVRDP